ncbi:MAG TPA: GWxTD domain-containing protein [Flavipsychrobacter sp.]|nr:GWxTD domain-containing protein [Flavipsychrobacter sp.]
MIRWLGLCICLFLFSSSSHALNAVVSHTIFYHQDTIKNSTAKPYIEVYWQIDPASLHYTRVSKDTTDKRWSATIKTDITFSNDKGVFFVDGYLLQTTPLLPNLLAVQNIIDLRRYELPEGKITMTLTLSESIDSTRKFTFTDTFTVHPPSLTAYFSGIQLLDTAYQSSEKSIFLKNGKQNIPLGTNFFDSNKNMLHYYAELYQTNTIPNESYPLTEHIFISRKEDENSILNLTKRDTVTPKQFQAISGSFLLSSVPSGNYYLNMQLDNKDGVTLISKSILFQRINNNPVTTSASKAKADSVMENVTVFDIGKSFTAKYSLPQLKAIMRMILPVASPMEAQDIKGFLKNPDEMYMRYFIYNFFHARNESDPGQAWKEFTDKVREVNKMYSTSSSPGYQSDRGYIYLKYGKPTDIITVENEPGSLPYEIWQYNSILVKDHKYSNQFFLFYRPAEMITGFELLHSTLPGELHNNGWRSYLYTNGTAGNNSNSRAEQYLSNY